MSDEAQAATLVLTTSYPRSDGDFGGHFVRADALRQRGPARPVHVLAFGTRGTPPSAHDAGIELDWLGGGSLFGTPGVLPRLEERRARALLLVWPLLRALWALRLRARYGRVVAHFLLLSGWPLGVWFARRGPTRGAVPLEVVAHGSDVRVFERLPSWLRRRIVSDLLGARATLRFVSHELRARALRSVGDAELERYLAAQPVSAAPLVLPELPSREAARAELGISDGETLVVVVGRLTAGKRTDVALRALELLPAARVTVVGDGPAASDLRASHPDVLFAGELERRRALVWMRAADLLLSASRLEGAPTAIREARLLGVPVVAAHAGDLAHWAKHDAELWIVD